MFQTHRIRNYALGLVALAVVFAPSVFSVDGQRPENTFGQARVLPFQGQRPEKTDLFERVNRSQSDLTPQQQESLAQLQRQPTTVETRLVRVKTQLLTSSASKLLTINIGKEFEVEKVETKPEEQAMTWIGKPLGPLDSAVFVVNGSNVTGTVRVGNELYSVRPLGGGLHAVVRQDEKKFPPEHPPEFNELEKQPANEFNTGALGDAPTGNQKLRVLVAYTPRVAANIADMKSFIDLALAETNDGYANSGVKVRVELAHAQLVNYQESGSQDRDLLNFRTRGDSIMDEIHTLRDAHQADVCVLLIEDRSYCGLASAILADESNAFAVVYHACATGYYSFAHEIGHLQGARHNIEADSKMTPFSYGHGYLNALGKWRTIMSYDCADGCPRKAFWSNPFVKYNGSPAGKEDCCYDARVLNETAAVITSFRN
jgi:peptidyl-Asp metalloendopeptidase